MTQSTARSPAVTALRVLLTLLAIATTLAVILVLVATLLAYRTDGSSMDPTLSDGDRVLIDPFSDATDIARFDVVALNHDGRRIIKRVIGLPGDTVRIDTTGGANAKVRLKPKGENTWHGVRSDVWRNRWGSNRACCAQDGTTGKQVAAVVPEGSYFVLGDNPAGSDDSRAYGWVSSDGVREIWLRVYPFDEIGALPGTFRLMG